MFEILVVMTLSGGGRGSKRFMCFLSNSIEHTADWCTSGESLTEMGVGFHISIQAYQVIGIYVTPTNMLGRMYKPFLSFVLSSSAFNTNVVWVFLCIAN